MTADPCHHQWVMAQPLQGESRKVCHRCGKMEKIRVRANETDTNDIEALRKDFRDMKVTLDKILEEIKKIGEPGAL